jgi:cytochrome c1
MMRFLPDGRARLAGAGLLVLLLAWLAFRSGPAPGGDRPGEDIGPPPPPPPQWPFRATAWAPLAFLFLAGLGLGAWAFLQGRERHDVAVALTGGDPRRAPELMTRYGCGGCHTIPGVPGADGKVAGPLTDMRARVFIGGVARNSPQAMIGWIVDPRAISPRTAMPATGITEAEARDVAAFLYAR